MEVWTIRNVGHRAGWTKRQVRQCLACQPVGRSIQMLRVMHVRIGVTPIKLKATGGRTQ